jgi:hypothetical protein
MTNAGPADVDKTVYFGVININENGRTVAGIDIWRNVITKELFCEEKRLGVLDIVEDIGMPRIEKGKKWAVAVSRIRKHHDRWRLVKLINQGRFDFITSDSESIIQVDVKDYRIIDDEWWSFLIERNVNRAVEMNSETSAR